MKKILFNRVLILVVCVAVVFVDLPDLFFRGVAASEEVKGVSLKPISGIAIVDGGAGWGLALKDNGAVFAWGDNSSGQLGNGTNDPNLTPEQVGDFGPGSGVIAISAGSGHGMALKADGTVLAWGANVFGQLGDGTQTSRSTPVPVTGLGSGSNVVAISAGFTHSLALKADGTVWCWGRNGLGACGIGSTSPNAQLTPVQVHGVNGMGSLTGVTEISAGNNTSMALTLDHRVLTWGNNDSGQVGKVGGNQLTPFEVLYNNEVIMDAIAIANAPILDASSSYALRSNGTVLAWGKNNNGQFGDGTNEGKNAAIPILIPNGDFAVADIAAGGFHSYAVTSDGRVLAWGDNLNGELGDGTFFGRALPLPPSDLDEANITEISAGSSFSLALEDNGIVWAWGDNSNGQLGDGSTTRRFEPVQVSTLGGEEDPQMRVKAISAGLDHALALRENGEVLAWGNNNSGQLGNNSNVQSPTPVSVYSLGPGSGVIEVVAGNAHSLALKGDGTVWAWGANGAAGRLGNNTSGGSSNKPVQVFGIGSTACQADNNNEGCLMGVVGIAGSQFAPYALLFDNTVVAWGNNGTGQLGGHVGSNSTTPVYVRGINNVGILEDVVAIGAYGGGGFALQSNGTVLSWGSNVGGTVGDGTVDLRPTPVQASGLGEDSGVSSVKGGSRHTLALKFDGTALAWGGNSSGQLGDGTTSSRLIPAPITTFSNVKELSAFPGTGGNHSLALFLDGSVLVWGANNVGQLGDGTVYTKNLTPSPVLYNPVTIYDRRQRSGRVD